MGQLRAFASNQQASGTDLSASSYASRVAAPMPKPPRDSTEIAGDVNLRVALPI